MNDLASLIQRAHHFTEKVQERILHSFTDNAAKAHLHWGQFVVNPRPDAQVGVYGSASAAIVLGLNERDDDQGRRKARNELQAYLESASEAQNQLAHNVKLAMTVLALAPAAGGDAAPKMLELLNDLLNRCTQTSNLWPAYSQPGALSTVQFNSRDSEVATAIILILLDEILLCLKSARHITEQGRIRTRIRASADRLEAAFASKRGTLDRFSTLIAVAVLTSKGREAKNEVRRAYREAVRTRDFADRKVFFYDCLKDDGTLTRDYFIVPPAVLTPILLGKGDVKSMDRALAVTAMHDLLNTLTDDGVFQTGQDMPSTVEQALVGLSLQAAVRGQSHGGYKLQLAKAYIQATQADSAGVPTKLVSFLVAILWMVTVVAVVGKAIPLSYRATPVLAQVFQFASATPEAVTQLLAAICGAWGASRMLFLRILGKTP